MTAQAQDMKHGDRPLDVVMVSHGDWLVWEQHGYIRRTARMFRCLERDPRIGRILLVQNTRTFAHRVRRTFSSEITLPPAAEYVAARSTVDRIGERSSLMTFYVPVPGELTTRWRRTLNRSFLSDTSVVRSIVRAMTGLGIVDPLLWVDDPFAARLIGRLGERQSVFDCIDDWRLNPRLSTFADELDDCYGHALAASDQVITVSRDLAERFAAVRDDVTWVPNGVDAERFDIEPADDPVELAGIPRPRVGYVAAMTDGRVDSDLVREAARALPGVSFVFVGPVSPADREQLPTLPNCHAIGRADMDRVPHLLGAFDATMIPHKLDAYNASAYPLKLLEYLAAGRPVAATPVSGVDDFGGLVHVGSGVAGFTRAIKAALAESPDPGLCEARKAAVRGFSWAARYEDIIGRMRTAPVRVSSSALSPFASGRTHGIRR